MEKRMERKVLTTGFELKELDEKKGVFAAYGSVFDNLDEHNDIVERGAFKESIKEWKDKLAWPALCYQHDLKELIGVCDNVKEDDYGLYIEGRLALGTQKGREVFELLQMKALRSMSIGYMPKAWDYDKEKDVMRLKQIKLYEVSFVTFPANPKAQVVEVKQLLTNGSVPTERQFERFLKEVGFSRKQACEIIAVGYRASKCQWDTDEQKADSVRDALEAVKKLTTIIGRASHAGD